MARVLRRLLTTWGMALAIVPFIVLFAYGAALVAGSAQGAAKLAVGGQAGVTAAIFVVSLIVFCGVPALLAWWDERKAGGGR